MARRLAELAAMHTSPVGIVNVTRRSIATVLDEARGRLERVGPLEAYAEIAEGAVLVDIRPASQRAAEGEIPGALVVERNVLEWRFDPESDARLPVAGYDLRVIVICSEGYTSSLAGGWPAVELPEDLQAVARARATAGACRDEFGPHRSRQPRMVHDE
jgi:rhodanese-related sulfurtransferase